MDTRPEDGLDISGEWLYRLDRKNVGIEEIWYSRRFDQPITLPGTLASAKIGDPVSKDTPWIGLITDPKTFLDPRYDQYSQGGYKPPFWLCPEHFYSGAAWYQKELVLDSSWGGSESVIELERCHWESRLWVDDVCIGSRNSLSTPHRYRLPKRLEPGSHRITLRIDNSYLLPLGMNAHSITDNTSGNWNGVLGRMRLSKLKPLRVESLAVHPGVDGTDGRLILDVVNETGRSWSGRVQGSIGQGYLPLDQSVELPPGQSRLELNYRFGQALSPWSEWDPRTYTLQLALLDKGSSPRPDHPMATVRFGYRRLETGPEGFSINGRPLFLRGNLECNIFPLEGHESLDEPCWEGMIRKAKDYGFNHFRFHSWCPPDAAFRAADRVGFYFQVEACAWAAHETKIGDGMAVDEYVRDEAERILREYGNHPSFCFLAYGNEGDGTNNVGFLTELVREWKGNDPRRLYTSSSGWPTTPENDFHSALSARAQRYDKVRGSTYRLQDFPPGTDFDFSKDVDQFSKPLISHEPGQWCAFPDLAEIPKYTGPVRAKNFELIRDELDARGLLSLAPEFLRASGRLQVLCFKAEIEAMLRTPHLGGFQLLSLQDFPGQGTATVGVLNSLWEEKGYTDVQEWSSFCAPTVLLARIPSLILGADEDFTAGIQLSHHGEHALSGCFVDWSIAADQGNKIAEGSIGPFSAGFGNGIPVGAIEARSDEPRLPAKYRLQVRLRGTAIANFWDFYRFPPIAVKALPPQIIRSQRFDSAVLKHLMQGGDALLELFGNLEESHMAKTGFTPVYWNSMCFNAQPIHTMGILCDPDHPLFGTFPTAYHSDYQWWDILTKAQAIVLDGAPQGYSPILRMIDSYHSNRSLGLIAEARVGKGRLLITGIDFSSDLDARPCARELWSNLVAYMAGPDFMPSATLTPDFLHSLSGGS